MLVHSQIGKKKSLLKIFYCLLKAKNNSLMNLNNAFKKWKNEIEKLSYKNRLNIMKITSEIEMQKVFIVHLKYFILINFFIAKVSFLN